MPRKLRLEYPGAIYHVINGGDRREDIFRDDADRARFVESKLQRLISEDLARLDALVAALEARHVSVRGWDIPGATMRHAHLHQARAICRRAERDVVAVRGSGAQVPELILQYLNRLSDALWLLACAEQNRAGG